jgi:hypothetical protein
VPPYTKQVFLTAGIFSGLVLVFTFISLFVSPRQAEIGTARLLDTIPAHEIELVALGVVLGAIALGVYGKGGLLGALLLPALVLLLDLDHIPAFLGLAQPIRPAHSLVFLAVDVTITTIILMRLDFALIGMSAFMGHLGIDSGVVPPYSPFSFHYVQLAPYHYALIFGSVISSLAAGYLMRRGDKSR